MRQKRDLVTKFRVSQTCKQGSICDFQGTKTLDFIWTHIIVRLYHWVIQIVNDLIQD